MKAIAIHSFAGGFDMGVAQTGFKLVAKFEDQTGFGIPVTELNRHLLGDFRSVSLPAVEWPIFAPSEGVALAYGNPPCSGFSGLNRSTGGAKSGAGSTINNCMRDLMRLAAACHGHDGRHGPEIIIMESVQRAYHHGRSLMQDLRREVEVTTQARYDLHHVVMNNWALGNAQRRPRYFCVLARVPFGVDPRNWQPTRPRVRDIIGDLVGLELKREEQPVVLPPVSTAQYNLRRPDNLVADHIVGPGIDHNELALHKLQQVWDDTPPGGRVPEEAWAKAFPGQAFKGWRFTRARKLAADGPMLVITGAGGPPFLHWSEKRSLTVRECARLTGFPDAWTFGELQTKVAYAGLGKGVTVQAGRWISEQAMWSLIEENRAARWPGEQIGWREYEHVLEAV